MSFLINGDAGASISRRDADISSSLRSTLAKGNVGEFFANFTGQCTDRGRLCVRDMRVVFDVGLYVRV